MSESDDKEKYEGNFADLVVERHMGFLYISICGFFSLKLAL